MINYRGELFPKDIDKLLSKAPLLAQEMVGKLNDKDCPRLNEFFQEEKKNNDDKTKCFVRKNLQIFEDKGYSPNIKSGNVKSDNEYKGLYVFGEEAGNQVTPIYIGISRRVYKRLRSHGWGKTPQTATLAFTMAQMNNKNLKRASCNNSDLIPQKEILKNCKVALYHVSNDYELYFLEVAIAGILQTKWNSFRTH